MVKASIFVRMLLSAESGKTLNVTDGLQAYKTCQLIMGITAFNLILQSGTQAYYQFLRNMHIFSSDSAMDIVGLVSITISIVCGVFGLIGAITHCTVSAKACLFGWLSLAVCQIGQAFIAVYGRHNSHVTGFSDLEELIILETVLCILFEVIFILCIIEFIQLCEWYKSVSFDNVQGYAPLLDNTIEDLDLESNNANDITMKDQQPPHYFQECIPSVAGRGIQYTST